MNVSSIAPASWRQLRACWQALDDKKAEHLRLLYVGPQSSITDFFLLATGTSEPHLKALASTLVQTLKAEGVRLVGRDVEPSSGWVVVDAFDFVIHLFLPELRSRYSLEQLWKDAVVVDFATIESAINLAQPKPATAPPAKPAAKKAAVKKTAVKKAAVKKAAVKKVAAKAPAVKKVAAKKAAATKPAAKKVAVKKAAAAKPAVKKAAVKKAVAEKPAAKKVAPKKVAPKKAAPKKAAVKKAAKAKKA